jgi:rare lipoprotein A
MAREGPIPGRAPRRPVVLVLALGVLSACTALLPVGWTGRQAGLASWYGPGLYGRRTASGTVHTGAALTAAHRSLPFGTRVRVTNLENGRAVVVVVDDRGPFVRGRVIDLSWAAAPRRTPPLQSCRAGNQVAARAARAASD